MPTIEPVQEVRSGSLVTWGCDDTPTHEMVTHTALARRAAQLLGRDYLGRLEAYTGSDVPYCIPRAPLFGEEGCRILGSDRPDPGAFLGGWVPAPLLATKAIVHPLAPDETPPDHWPAVFADRARTLVLDGATAFTFDGGLAAGRTLLGKGAVRIKAVGASGGTGQYVAYGADDLERILRALEAVGILNDGIVLEENLSDAKTYSVGRIRLGEARAAYFGTQELTPNNSGEEVYGGSRLFVTRGGYRELIARIAPDFAAICRIAIAFDQLADAELGLIASRRNYDVITGIDGAGRRRLAVLEQSWRVGGASPAEFAALDAFAREPELAHTVASSVERYGLTAVPPGSATLYFHGVDPVVGPLLKYAVVRDDR
jgi:Protein of unknown function (DUF3182).